MVTTNPSRDTDRNGGGVALYAHASMPVKRLTELELEDEEWIWTKIKTQNQTILICCIHLPPSLNANRLELFIDRLTESICQPQKHTPTVTIILGDLNAGNVYLDQTITNHSGITSFDC